MQQSTIFPSIFSACLCSFNTMFPHAWPSTNLSQYESVSLSSCGFLEYACEFNLDLPEGSRFPKGKICFEHQFSYIYTEVIKANLWFKGSGYYSETLRALSLSKKYFYIHTKPPTDTITKNCPRNSSEGYRNSLCSRKTKYPWALNITLHYFRSILGACSVLLLLSHNKCLSVMLGSFSIQAVLFLVHSN